LVLKLAAPTRIDTAVAGLDAWLETMRGPDGYGGPVAHWWQQSLLYTGAGLDWRYEGIIAGYLHLWERTGAEHWLEKARRAGDDLVAGQFADGHFAASAFEFNPATAGTPHEAACDVGLLLLALALRAIGQDDWRRYANCAERNLRAGAVAQLWDGESRSFRDSPETPSFVPNKAATICEALFLLSEVTGEGEWIERYAIPTLDRILDHQVRRGGQFAGAIAQNSFGQRTIERYYPLYVARCVPALLRGYRATGDGRYAEGALQAVQFIARWKDADGALPTLVYANGRANWCPTWIAPLADVLRAADEVRPFGLVADFAATAQRLLAGQDRSGGIQTARGFAAQAGGRAPRAPDLRDVLHVTGWCDKAFRYLASHAGPDVPTGESAPFEVACTFLGQETRLVETSTVVEVTRGRHLCYRWNKGERWPALATQEFWLR
jgi:hypothetical protein